MTYGYDMKRVMSRGVLSWYLSVGRPVYGSGWGYDDSYGGWGHGDGDGHGAGWDDGAERYPNGGSLSHGSDDDDSVGWFKIYGGS